MSADMYKQVSDVDWENWVPEVRATLMFVFQEGRVLLIHKKRGFGKDKINGPGGKMEPGETPLACAIRETEEELCICVPEQSVTYAGLLQFQFCDGLSIEGHVFSASEFSGVPTETDEARPLWFDLNDIPFERMWEDDRHWFPYMLSKTIFRARFIFDGDRMVDKCIQ